MDQSKPRWPYVKAPYLMPSWLILIGFCLQTLGFGPIITMAGLIAWIYAYRKRHTELTAEKKWWREFRARQSR